MLKRVVYGVVQRERSKWGAWPHRQLVLAAVVAVLAACGDDGTDGEAPECVEGLSAACTARWAPTYDDIFDQVLEPRCGGATTGASCHYEAAPAGSLYLFDREMAYNALVNGHAGGAASVIPGDAACSPLILRLTSDDPGFRMPRGGASFTAEELCTFVQWIESGAAQTAP